MDFVDHRKSPKKEVSAKHDVRRDPTTSYHTYVDYLIEKAQHEGLFDNLPGNGKPLKSSLSEPSTDDALTKHVLKSLGFRPPEVELQYDIKYRWHEIGKLLARLEHRKQYLLRRRIPLLRDQRAFQAEVLECEAIYERQLRKINSNILSLNIVAPPTMNQRPIPVEQLLDEYRQRFFIYKDA